MGFFDLFLLSLFVETFMYVRMSPRTKLGQAGIAVLLVIVGVVAVQEWINAFPTVGRASVSRQTSQREVVVATSIVPPQRPAAEGDGGQSETIHNPLIAIRTRKRELVILLYGRVSPRYWRASERSVPRETPGALLRRVRHEIDKYVVAPNQEAFNITVVFRVEDPNATSLGDAPVSTSFVLEHFGQSSASTLNVVLATDPQPLTIQERSLFNCGYRMWSNIEMGVRKVRELEVSWGVSFDFVLVLRADVHLNTPFELRKLNPALFYLANICVTTYPTGKNKVFEKRAVRMINCSANDTMPIPPNSWREDRPPLKKNKPGNCQHRLVCKALVRNHRFESLELGLPDFYMLGNSTTMNTMFATIVEDWHAGKFRKSHAHCNHGVLGGRVLMMRHRVKVGRYLYHRIDVQIPRVTSWYPKPSLNEYLESRGALWPTGRPSYDVAAPRFESFCRSGVVCANENADAFSA